MSTYITLEDGRVWGTTNGLFDTVLEAAAAEIAVRPDSLEGLAEWLLEQRCEVLGPGVGYLDLRELSPRARVEFTQAFTLAYEKLSRGVAPVALEHVTALGLEHLAVLMSMWASIARGEPPEALTSPYWIIHPYGGERHGPGWPEL